MSTSSNSHTSSSRRRRLESRKAQRRRRQCAIRILSTTLEVIAISLFSAAVPIWNSTFTHNSGPFAGDWTDVGPILPLSFALLFDVYYVAYALRATKQPPPTASMVAELLIWPTLVTTIAFSSAGGLFRLWKSAVKNQDGQTVCNALNLFAEECEPIFYRIGRLQLAAISFAGLVWFLHFSFFVLSMSDVLTEASRRKQRQQRKRREFERWYHSEVQASRERSAFAEDAYRSAQRYG